MVIAMKNIFTGSRVLGFLVVVSFLLSANMLCADGLGPAEKGSFSIIALPDTQFYADKEPETFYAQTQWIVDNLEKQKIVFVSHLGDIVESVDAEEEWGVAAVAMYKLDGKVPYGMVVGNHDMTGKGEAVCFTTMFPGKHYVHGNYDWYGGYLDNNMASFQTFEAEGLKFVILHLPCNAPDHILKWAEMVLKTNSDRRAIISTHMFLGPVKRPKKSKGYTEDEKGVMEWNKCFGKYGNTPKQMWDKCFSKYKNIFLILCGDQSASEALNIKLKGENGNTVHACLSDYKRNSIRKKDNGFLRIYRFYPQANKIKVMTYSATFKKLCKGTDITPDISKHQFTLKYDMTGTYSGQRPGSKDKGKRL